MSDPKITAMFNKKMARLDKTSLSILCSWATNCAIATLSEKTKEILTGDGLTEIIKLRRDMFIEMYREWMLDNLPREARELTEQEIAEFMAKKEEVDNSKYNAE